MAKRCMICGDKATLRIKNGSEFYCDECALMQFGDVAMLVKIADDAAKLKKYTEREEDFKLHLEED